MHRPITTSAFRALLGLALACSLLGAPRLAEAQDRDEFQLWAAMLGTAATQPAPPDFAFWLDVHGRRGSGGTVVLVRPGVGFEVTRWLSVWAGYAWIPTMDDSMGGDASHEHRIWQQVVLKHSLPEVGLSMQSRTRFEQRFSDRGDDVALRIREFVRLNWRPVADVPLGIAVWDELFVGLTENDWNAPQGIDQNRIFVGPFLQMEAWARLEAGYLFVYLDRGNADLYAHVLAVNLFVSPRPPAAPTPSVTPIP